MKNENTNPDENHKPEEKLDDILLEFQADKAYHEGRCLTISEVIAFLRKERFEVTTQQLRKYEKLGLLIPAEKTEAKYRLYDGKNIGQLRTILAMRMLDLPLKKIKRYFELVPRVKETAQQFFRVKPYDHRTSVEAVNIFSDEKHQIYNDGIELMKELNLEKINKADPSQRKYLQMKLKEIDELEEIVKEVSDKWYRIKELSDRYSDIFGKQMGNISFMGRRIQSILEGDLKNF